MSSLPSQRASYPHTARQSGIVLLALLALTNFALAAELAANGYYRTGEAVREKHIAMVNVKVYRITHEMKKLPLVRSKQAMIDINTDKAFTMTMLRDVESDKIQKALREAFAMNGYQDQAKIDQFISAFGKQKQLKKDTAVVIAYNADTQVTTVSTSPTERVSIPGYDFMKATWSIWFGKIDDPHIGDALMAGVPASAPSR